MNDRSDASVPRMILSCPLGEDGAAVVKVTAYRPLAPGFLDALRIHVEDLDVWAKSYVVPASTASSGDPDE